MPANTLPLRVFIYGSLKSGYRNHAAYCSGFQSFRPGEVTGRLFRQAIGYPMLIVPPESILATATADLERDRALFAELAQRDEAKTDVAAPPWQAIRGELYQWGEPGDRLARLDELEEFFPDGSQPSLYHRVIVPVRHAAGADLAWTYVAPGGIPPDGSTPMGRSWP